MIRIHRLTQPGSTLYLNADHIQTIESTPDTVITTIGGARLVVMESPEQLAEEVRQWRASIAAAALDVAPASSRPRLAAVVAGPTVASHPVVEEHRGE
jgi:flagellar protein FlbD